MSQSIGFQAILGRKPCTPTLLNRPIRQPAELDHPNLAQHSPPRYHRKRAQIYVWPGVDFW